MNRRPPHAAATPAPAPFVFDAPVTLIGGGEVDPTALAEAEARSAALIGADGGANRFAAEKERLAAVIGDLDSLEDRGAWRSALGTGLLHLEEQDSTDLEKCLYSVDAPLYFGVGFQGGRIDHSLAAAHALLKWSERRVVLLGIEDVVFLAPRRWRLHLPIGARVSLFPLAPTRARRSTGLRWALDGLTLRPGVQIGTSNEADADTVEAEFEGEGEGEEIWSGVLALLERAHLDAALKSLAAAEKGALS